MTDFIETWSRNSFDAECVRVTEENIHDVAEWCEGSITRLMTKSPKTYIRFNVIQYNEHREAKAFLGDWILLVNDEFKHYRDEAFRRAYTQKKDQREEVFSLMKTALCVECNSVVEQTETAEYYTNLIVKLFGEK